ncbi:MAG: T9SS type A sorting domain-containing protein [Ignavibacteria bacterium]|nr:T9SS type A sorting domain-containing protein [Ignavibacteria bacterium]MBI3766669.1 T9SS type A sorting domain-containing protein [Ignavibacteriales bacterium]
MRRNIIITILTAFVSITNAQQQDSLVDVFPLSVGNKWVYHYSYDFYWYKPPTWIDDSGKVEMEVVEKNAIHDTLVWKIRQRWIVRHHFRTYGDGDIDTTYDIDTAVTTNLHELQSEQHALFTDCNFDCYCRFNPYSCVFFFRCLDTGKVYRYQYVNKDGNVTVIGDYYPVASHHLTFRHNEGLLSDSLSTVGGTTTQRIVNLLSSTIVPVKESEKVLPQVMRLFQNYPNPFNPNTSIEYQLPTAVYVRIGIYNVLGEEIATLVNEKESPGSYTVQWDGGKCPSGIYFYKMNAGSFSETKKFLLLK